MDAVRLPAGCRIREPATVGQHEPVARAGSQPACFRDVDAVGTAFTDEPRSVVDLDGDLLVCRRPHGERRATVAELRAGHVRQRRDLQ